MRLDCFPLSFVNLEMFKKSVEESVHLTASQIHAMCACVDRQLFRTQQGVDSLL